MINIQRRVVQLAVLFASASISCQLALAQDHSLAPPASILGEPSPSCITIDPQQGVLPAGRTPLCGDIAGEVVLDGYFRNSFSAALDRVVVTSSGARPRIVCIGSACADFLSNYRDVAAYLQARGHQGAAQVTSISSRAAVEIVETYEDPCVLPGEGELAYKARAQAHCRLYVIDRMPWYTWAARVSAATNACSAVATRQQMKGSNPGEDDLCFGP